MTKGYRGAAPGRTAVRSVGIAINLPENTTPPMVLPGIKISTSPDRAMKGVRLARFDGMINKLSRE